jgi:two-component system, LytTR family, response regulator LytT
MNILLIEDETEAAKNIRWLIERIEPAATIVAVIETVVEGIEWLKTKPNPDLIISDIQLADGNSFEIFDEIKPKCPVIFTTAFNQFAIQSFEVHSIDYLLKPISEAALAKAINKYKSLNISTLNTFQAQLEQFLIQQNTTPKNYRKSFLIRFRDKIIPLKTDDFAYFMTKDGLVYGLTQNDKKYIIENTLEELENQLNPEDFFRANRQFIVSRDAIVEVEFYFNGRLLLKTQPNSEENILVSKERVPVFRRWFEAVT